MYHLNAFHEIWKKVLISTKINVNHNMLLYLTDAHVWNVKTRSTYKSTSKVVLYNENKESEERMLFG